MKAYPRRIYLSATWNGNLRAETVQLANWIGQHDVTVVRDYKGNEKNDPLKSKRTWVQRIDYMLRDCSGLVAILPLNDDATQTSSPNLIPELLAADGQGIPILVFANRGVDVKTTKVDNELVVSFPKVQSGQILRLADLLALRPDQGNDIGEILKKAGGFALKHPENFKGILAYPNNTNHRAPVDAIEDFVEACVERKPYPFVFNVLPFSILHAS